MNRKQAYCIIDWNRAIRSVVVLLLLSVLFCPVPSDAKLIKRDYPLPSNMTRASIWYELLHKKEDIKGVLILCPGNNGDGKHFMLEREWRSFAIQNKFAIAAISFASRQSDIVALRGYLWAEEGSGQVLLDGIKQELGKSLPLYLYGFSSGAYFVLTFVEWKADRVKSWCACSPWLFDLPKASEHHAPGIIACGDFDAARYSSCYRYFYKGRMLKRPWTWVSLAETGHERHSGLEDFARKYFLAIEEENIENHGVLSDIDTKNRVENRDAIGMQEGLIAWLPNVSILKFWGEVHQP